MDISNLMEPLHQVYATAFREAARVIAQNRKKLEDKLNEYLKFSSTFHINKSLICIPIIRDKAIWMSTLSKEIIIL